MPIPNAPTNVLSKAVTPTEILVSWWDTSDADNRAVQFRVERDPSPTGLFSSAGVVDAPRVRFLDGAGTITPESLWYYRVVAINEAAEESEPSEVVGVATPAEQPIFFWELPDRQRDGQYYDPKPLVMNATEASQAVEMRFRNILNRPESKIASIGATDDDGTGWVQGTTIYGRTSVLLDLSLATAQAGQRARIKVRIFDGVSSIDGIGDILVGDD